MAKKTPTIYRTTTARFRSALDSVDSMLDLAETFLREKTNEVPNEMGDVRVLAILMLARAGIALRSSKLLFTHGHENDAMSVSRTIVELLIDLKYIRTEEQERLLVLRRQCSVAFPGSEDVLYEMRRAGEPFTLSPLIGELGVSLFLPCC